MGAAPSRLDGIERKISGGVEQVQLGRFQPGQVDRPIAPVNPLQPPDLGIGNDLRPHLVGLAHYHRIGTPQSADTLVYATPDNPALRHGGQVTHDGRWAVVTTSRGTDAKYELHLIRLDGGKSWPVQHLVDGLDHEWRLIEGIGDTLYFSTNLDAPKLKVVKVDLANRARDFSVSEVVAERAETLDRAQIVGNRLVLSYLKDAASTAEVLSLDGKPGWGVLEQIAMGPHAPTGLSGLLDPA